MKKNQSIQVKKIGSLVLCLLAIIFTIYFSLNKENTFISTSLNTNEKIEDYDTLSLNVGEKFDAKIASYAKQLEEVNFYLKSDTQGILNIKVTGSFGNKETSIKIHEGLNNIVIPIQEEVIIDSILHLQILNTTETSINLYGTGDAVVDSENFILKSFTKGYVDEYHNKMLLLSVVLLIISFVLIYFYCIKSIDKTNEIINKIYKKIDKFILKYIFEVVLFFIVILSLMNVIYNFLYFKQILFNWGILFIVSLIIFIIYVVELILHSNKELYKIYIIIGLPLVMAYIILMVPNSVPDELSHFRQAYWVSLFNLDNPQYVSVPSDLITGHHYNYYEMIQSLTSSTDYSDIVNSDVHAGYNFVVYAASAIGLFLGKLFNLSIMSAYLLGRFFNAILFIFLTQYALKKLPFGKLVLFIYLLSPMMLQEAISYSADSLINAFSILTLSYILFIVYRKKRYENIDIIILGICFVVLTLSKFIYLPIYLLLFIDFNKLKQMNIKQFLMIFGFIFMALVMYWYFMIHIKIVFNTSDSLSYAESVGVNTSEQINLILHQPIYFAKVIMNTFNVYGSFYLSSMLVSPLGWLNININLVALHLYFLILIIALFIKEEKIKMNYFGKFISCIIITIIISLVFVALYVTWSGVGSYIIMGVQGRYFLPIGILLLLAITGSKRIILMNPEKKLIITLLIVHLLVFIDIFNFFSYINI